MTGLIELLSGVTSEFVNGGYVYAACRPKVPRCDVVIAINGGGMWFFSHNQKSGILIVEVKYFGVSDDERDTQ